MTLRAQNSEPVPYDETWPATFAELARQVRGALGPAALRIDHVGPTAVLGAWARPMVDIQVSVESFKVVKGFEAPLAEIGFEVQPTDDLTSRLFGRPVDGRAQIHVRVAGSYAEQRALLVRDYLRTHPGTSTGRDLDDDESADTWAVLQQADVWSRESGWTPPESGF